MQKERFEFEEWCVERGRTISLVLFSEVLEAGTGIEPVYTDLQSAASPLRQPA